MSSPFLKVASVMFERGGVRAIFDHVRNLLVATIIVAAGLDTAKRGDAEAALHILIDPVVLSYAIASLGVVLIVANFLDGLRKLRRFRWHAALQIALGLTYLIVSVRLVQIVVFYRTHGC